MRVLILSTETEHHKYFIKQLFKFFSDIHVIFEKETPFLKYATMHEFEKLRDKFEKRIWTDNYLLYDNNIRPKIYHIENINDFSSIQLLEKIKADICFVFGTRKISAEMINKLPANSFNFHGGDPERYRGLDSHLWAIWHQEFSGLKVCLHRLTKQLDEGEIFKLKSLNFIDINNLYQLRAENTRVCIELGVEVLKLFESGKDIVCQRQTEKGRYYSAMPAVLKDSCVQKFKKFIKKTKNDNNEKLD